MGHHKTNSGLSGNNKIILPLHNGGNYDFTVDWGDGTTSRVTSWDSSDKIHTYASPGKYTLKITGQIEGFRFNNGIDKNKLISISSWGPLKLGSGPHFRGAENLVSLPSAAPDLTGITSFDSMFRGATSFNSPIDNWNVSNITNMDSMFRDATSFNQPLDNWDVSKVTRMGNMFRDATSFNQSLNNWDVSKVNLMNTMFWGASSFNQPLNNWDVSKVTNMNGIFRLATSFNQNLTGWRVCHSPSRSNFDKDASSWNSSYKPLFGQPCPPPDYFESLWDTTKTSSGSSNSNSITLPLHSGGTYNFTVDWGDGTKTKVTSHDSSNKTHAYASSGVYTLNITGQIEGFGFNGGGDRNKLINISSWGPPKTRRRNFQGR